MGKDVIGHGTPLQRPKKTQDALQEFIDQLPKQDVKIIPPDSLGSMKPIEPTKKLTGGLVSYYLCNVTHPQREVPPYVAECEDIAEFLKMTPDEFDIFKAIWRSAAARLGNGKPDHKAIYDAEKMVHKSGRILRRLKREAESETTRSPV